MRVFKYFSNLNCFLAMFIFIIGFSGAVNAEEKCNSGKVLEIVLKDSQKANIEKLQSALKKQGYYPFSVDGAFGPGTLKAVLGWLGSEGFDDVCNLGKSEITSLRQTVAKFSNIGQSSGASAENCEFGTHSVQRKIDGKTKFVKECRPASLANVKASDSHSGGGC